MSPPSLHRDAEPDRGLAVHPKHRLRRIGIAAADLGDVAETDGTIADREVDVQDVELGIERARDPQRQPLLAGLQDAGGPHRVLRLQGGDQRRIVEAERGQALGRELEEDLLVLGADDLDLRDVGHQQQARARILDEVAQLAMGEAVGGEAVDDAEDVAELVVEAGADDPGRQRGADVADLLAHVVPAVRHLASRRVAAQVDEDRGDAGTGVAGEEVEAWHLLDLALDALGHLQHGVLERGAGPGGLHHHGAEGEGRVLVAAEAEEGEAAGDHGGDHEIDDERAAPDGPLREIGADHRGSPRQADLLAGSQRLHAGGHHDITGLEALRDQDAGRIVAQHLDVAQRDRLACRIDDPDRGLPVGPGQRRGRHLDAAGTADLHAPAHGRAEPHGGRRIGRARP